MLAASALGVSGVAASRRSPKGGGQPQSHLPQVQGRTKTKAQRYREFRYPQQYDQPQQDNTHRPTSRPARTRTHANHVRPHLRHAAGRHGGRRHQSRETARWRRRTWLPRPAGERRVSALHDDEPQQARSGRQPQARTRARAADAHGQRRRRVGGELSRWHHGQAGLGLRHAVQNQPRPDLLRHHWLWSHRAVCRQRRF